MAVRLKDDTVLSHIPRKISRICSLFSARGGAITCTLIGRSLLQGLKYFNKAILEHVLTQYIHYNFWCKIFLNVILFCVFKFRIAATHMNFF